MRYLTRVLTTAAVIAAVVVVGGPAPEAEAIPAAACTVTVTNEGTAQCVYLATLPPAVNGVLTLATGAGETAFASVHCTMGGFATAAPGAYPFPRVGVCVLQIVGTGTAWATATAN